MVDPAKKKKVAKAAKPAKAAVKAAAKAKKAKKPKPRAAESRASTPARPPAPVPPTIEIEHDAETITAINKQKVDLFKRDWYEKKAKPKKDKAPSTGASYSEQVGHLRYVRKRRKKKK